VIVFHDLGKHTIFGRVKDGMETVKRIGMCPCDNADRPKNDISIFKGSVTA
jgi:peptidyl-prolyl cis-trans isomerase-like 1